MHHISRKKSRVESIEVSIDRSLPDVQHVNFPSIAIHFFIERGLHSEKSQYIDTKEAIGCHTRPENFILRPQHGLKHPHKISDRFNYPNPFSSWCDIVARALVTNDYFTSIFFLLECLKCKIQITYV